MKLDNNLLKIHLLFITLCLFVLYYDITCDSNKYNIYSDIRSESHFNYCKNKEKSLKWLFYE